MDRTQNLAQEGVGRLLIRFSLPGIIGMSVNALYSVVDRIVIGHGIGPDGIAALTVCVPILMIMMAFGMMIGFGGTTLVSLHLGAGRKIKAEEVLGNALTLYLFLSIAFAAFGLTFMSPLFKLFGAGSSVLPLARDYLTIILLGVLPHEITFGMNMFILAEGNPYRAMTTMLIGAGLNILLDPLFIFYLDWGMHGAAVATVASQTVSAFWVLTYFSRGRSRLKLRWKYLRLQPERVKRIAFAGSPSGVITLTGSAIQALLNSRLQLYGGDMAISVMGILLGISSLIRMPIAGLLQGARPIIGYNFGASQFQRVRHVLVATLAASSIVTLLWFLIAELHPARLMQLFTPQDQNLIDLGTSALQIFLFMLPVAGLEMVCASYFQAIGKPQVALSLALFRQFLLLAPLILTLPLVFGLKGIWYAAPTADLAAALLACYLLFKHRNHISKAKETMRGISNSA